EVDMTVAECGNTLSLRELIPTMQQHGVIAVSANGVLGDPTSANAGEGATILSRWTKSLVDAVDSHFEHLFP
ncbi:hypothetical protein ACFWWS_39700, partial [Streptomyces sp. NPDC059083]